MPFGAKINLSPTLDIEIEVLDSGKVMQNQINLIEAVSFWQALPTVCPMPGCGASLIFTARHPGTFHYHGLRCLGPKPHEANFGKRQDETSLFLKDGAWKDAFTGDEEQNSGPAASQSSATPAQTTASPAGDKVDAGTIRMIQAVANGKPGKPSVDGVAQQFFNKNLVDLTKVDAMAVLEYLKTL